MSTIGPGLKFDADKLRVDLLPVRALQEVAKVLTFGAKKYQPNNWQNVKPRRRYYRALISHAWARALGEKIDQESGLPHMAHCACNALFLLSLEVGIDDPDAFEDGPVAELTRRACIPAVEQSLRDNAPLLARLDADGTAEPKTRLVVRRAECDPAAPARTVVEPSANEYVADDGRRIPLTDRKEDWYSPPKSGAV